MQAVGVYTHVNRAYAQSESHQWAREAVVNSIQAGATNIQFGIEWQAVKQKGVYRRIIADDGCGMPPQAMPAFLNKYGGSGRTIGDITGNYGIGLKTSILPWNFNGVVVLSVVTDAEGVKRASMMWLHRGLTKEGNVDYGARELVTEEVGGEDDFIADWTSTFEAANEALAVLPLDRLTDYFEDFTVDGIDWMKVIPPFVWEAGHGTVIVLLGDTGEDDTVKGDPHRESEGNSKYALTEYLNSRFYRLPEGVTITVQTPESDKDWRKKEYWPKTQQSKGVNKRTVCGMEKCLQHYAEMGRRKQKTASTDPFTETVLINGDSTVSANVTTYLFPNIGESKPGQDSWTGYQSGDAPSVPIFAYIHEAHPGIIEAFGVQTHARGKTALFPWVNTDTVRRRLAIVVEPLSTDDAKVFPDPSRRTLHYQDRIKGGADLPVEEWTASYQSKRPQFITNAINDYFADFASMRGEIDDETLRRVGEQYLPYMNTILVERYKGTRRRRRHELDNDNAGEAYIPIGTGGPRIPSQETGRGSGRLFKVPYGLLEAITVDKPYDPKDKDALPLQQNSDLNPNQGPTIEIHLRHPMIQAAWQACKQRLVQKNGVPIEQLDTFEQAFYQEVELHVRLATTHLWTFVKNGRQHLRDKLFSPEALTSIVAGIRPLQQAAQGIFGTIKAGKGIQ